MPDYKAQVPPVQGIAMAYGTWQDVIKTDPSGQLLNQVLRNTVFSALYGAGVGYALPDTLGFTAKEGARWGAVLGLSMTLYQAVKNAMASPAPPAGSGPA